jgi:hypothetical protein
MRPSIAPKPWTTWRAAHRSSSTGGLTRRRPTAHQRSRCAAEGPGTLWAPGPSFRHTVDLEAGQRAAISPYGVPFGRPSGNAHFRATLCSPCYISRSSAISLIHYGRAIPRTFTFLRNLLLKLIIVLSKSCFKYRSGRPSPNNSRVMVASLRTRPMGTPPTDHARGQDLPDRMRFGEEPPPHGGHDGSHHLFADRLRAAGCGPTRRIYADAPCTRSHPPFLSDAESGRGCRRRQRRRTSRS